MREESDLIIKSNIEISPFLHNYMKGVIVLTLELAEENRREFKKNAPVGDKTKIHTQFYWISKSIFHYTEQEDCTKGLGRRKRFSALVAY